MKNAELRSSKATDVDEARAEGSSPWWLRTTWWLRLEGAALACLAVGIFELTDTSWWLFAALILAPDMMMIGYLRGPRIGAATYNIAHTYAVPVGVAASGLALDATLPVAIAAIWIAHIGIDRMFGYGLKHPEGFRHTHLR
ncbi:DUF4260 domain-containing protein [Sagittula sp. NFXS13]